MADRWAFIWAYTFGTRRAVLEKHEDTGAVRALVSKESRPGEVERVSGGGMVDPISAGKNASLILEADPPDAFERDLVERGGFTSKEAALIASKAK
jgi:hypothetical protein